MALSSNRLFLNVILFPPGWERCCHYALLHYESLIFPCARQHISSWWHEAAFRGTILWPEKSIIWLQNVRYFSPQHTLQLGFQKYVFFTSLFTWNLRKEECAIQCLSLRGGFLSRNDLQTESAGRALKQQHALGHGVLHVPVLRALAGCTSSTPRWASATLPPQLTCECTVQNK